MSGSSFSHSLGAGLADVSRFEAATAVFRGLDYRDGGGSCRSVVDHLRRWGEEVLAAARTDRIRARMLVAQADLIANIYCSLRPAAVARRSKVCLQRSRRQDDDVAMVVAMTWEKPRISAAERA